MATYRKDWPTPSGEIRLCIDMRRANEAIETCPISVPLTRTVKDEEVWNDKTMFLASHEGDTTTNTKREVIGPLQDPVTWYWINYAGTQVTQWDFQNKGKSGWNGTSSFVLEVPLCNLRPSAINSVPCDRILQRAYCVGISRRQLRYEWVGGNVD